MTIAPEIVAAAQAAQKKWGVPSSVALAQYGLESGWGRYTPPGSNNFFGIQALPGLPSVAANSHEFRDGRLVPVVEHFAVFKDANDAFDRHAELLATYRAYRYAIAQKDNPVAFAEALTGVYATAPHYGDILIGIMKSQNLQQYDVKAGG
jgi:flagellum-specific peptidoglycan hydrolase FlgJ